MGATATELGAGGSVSYVGQIRLRTNEEIDHLYPILDLNLLHDELTIFPRYIFKASLASEQPPMTSEVYYELIIKLSDLNNPCSSAFLAPFNLASI